MVINKLRFLIDFMHTTLVMDKHINLLRVVVYQITMNIFFIQTIIKNNFYFITAVRNIFIYNYFNK